MYIKRVSDGLTNMFAKSMLLKVTRDNIDYICKIHIISMEHRAVMITISLTNSLF